MFCNHCGKPNLDSSTFCSSCGKPLSATVTPQTTLTYTVETFYKRFRIAWREFVTSPFTLILIICYSLSALLTIFQIDTAFSGIESLLGIIDSLSDSSQSSPFLLNLLKICLCAPSILIAVSMWVIYADGLNHSDRPIDTKGFSVFRLMTVLTAILWGAGIFLLFIGILSSAGYSSSSAETNALTVVIIGLIIGAAIGFFIMRMYIRLIDNICNTVENCTYSVEYVKACAILQFIASGLSVITLLGAEISLSNLLSAALPALFGVILLKYKDLMETLNYEKECIRKQNNPKKGNPWEKLYK